VVEQSGDLGLVSDVGLQRGGGAAGSLDRGHRLLGPVGVAGVVHDDGHSGPSQALADGSADAAGAAGYQRDAGG